MHLIRLLWKTALQWSVFGAFAVLSISAITFALTYNWSDPSAIRNKISGNALTSTGWNLLVGNVDNLNERLASVEGKIVWYAYTNNVTRTTIAGAIPYDDTVPQSTEGTEIMSANITPKSASNLLEVEAIVHYAEVVNSSDFFVLAGFKDSATSAFAASTATTVATNCSPGTYAYICQAVFKAVIPAGTTSPVTIHLRGGIDAWTAEINGSNGRKLWGALTSSLTVREIAQ